MLTARINWDRKGRGLKHYCSLCLDIQIWSLLSELVVPLSLCTACWKLIGFFWGGGLAYEGGNNNSQILKNNSSHNTNRIIPCRLFCNWCITFLCIFGLLSYLMTWKISSLLSVAGSQHEGKQIFGLLAPSGCFVEEFSVTAPVKTSKVSPEKELKIPHEILSLYIKCLDEANEAVWIENCAAGSVFLFGWKSLEYDWIQFTLHLFGLRKQKPRKHTAVG